MSQVRYLIESRTACLDNSIFSLSIENYGIKKLIKNSNCTRTLNVINEESASERKEIKLILVFMLISRYAFGKLSSMMFLVEDRSSVYVCCVDSVSLNFDGKINLHEVIELA